MTDYYRPAPRPTAGPSFQPAPAPRDNPARQGSAPVSSSRWAPSDGAPVDKSQGSSIKCSDCGSWVELFELGEHICGASGGLAVPPSMDASEAERRRRRPEMRLDIEPAVPRLAAYGARSRSPLPSPGFLGPSSPSSRPASPGDDIARSPSSTSSSSGSKLPFFERYQKMVGDITSPPSPTMSRSGAMQNLHSLGSEPPLSPSISRSPSPLKYASSGTARSHAHSQSSYRNPADDGASELRYASSADSHSSDSPARTMNETPASSVISGSPPRSRKASIPESSHTSSYQSSRTGPATMKVSQSTPSGLSSQVRPPVAVRPRSRSEEDRRVGGGLEACLEDLRLMTRDDDDDDGGASDILASFRSPRSESPPPMMPPFDEEAAGSDGMSTPRAVRRQNIPHSQSAPLFPSLESNSSAKLNPSTSSSSGNLTGLANGGRSASKPRASHCTTCRRVCSQPEIQRAGDGQTFCRPCYADRFLPKCRKCKQPIEGGAVASSDGKVLGKYHPGCFSCFSCSSPFPNKEFYVFDYKPYCQHHYHELNGSLCADQKCGDPIEGPCVSLVGEDNGGGGRYHPNCFKCSERSCRIPLLDHHFVVKGFPYCERHAEVKPARSSSSKAPTSRARKRQTFITKR